MKRIVFTLQRTILAVILYANGVIQITSGINRATDSGENLRVGAVMVAIKISEKYFPEEGLKGIYDNLYTKTLIVDNGTNKITLIVIDLTSIFPDEVGQVKKLVTQYSGIQSENVIVVASHTFSAPHVRSGLVSNDESEKNTMLSRAIDNSIEKWVLIAKEKMQAAKVGYGIGHPNVNVNRNIFTADGWWHGNNEHGISDKNVAVVCFEDLNGKPLAILIKYAVQSAVMDGSEIKNGGRLVTADLQGAACRNVGKEFGNGCIAFFLTGAARDQHPYFTSNRYVVNKNGNYSRKDIQDEGFDMVDIQGEYLGSEVINICKQIKNTITNIPLKVHNLSLKGREQKRPEGVSGRQPHKVYDYQAGAETEVPVSILQIGDIFYARPKVY